ncbi:hypothetical protein LCGC14_1213610 [marine sediment metagenome]|uniref:Uncharacterized protein n=1 Tax=marine sediment metagenome TaxID=412755 RepID=A0A0F9LDD8_9ZZZZ
MTTGEIKELLKREIDFRGAARKIREFQIEDSENAWELFYATHENDPKLHYGPHLEKLVTAGADHDSLCDAFDEVFTDLLNEALKKVQLKIVEED